MRSTMRGTPLAAALFGALGATATAQTSTQGPAAASVLPADSAVPVGNAVVGDVDILPPQANQGLAISVTHVDHVPVYREEGEAALATFAAASRAAPGNSRLDVLKQASRSNTMTSVATWSGSAPLTRHIAASATRDYRHDLLPENGSICDERL